MLDTAVFYVKAAADAVVSIFGVRLSEEPAYETMAVLGDRLDIRAYGPRVIAQTQIAATSREASASDAFSILADYIFGKNKAKTRIDMTAPVETLDPQRIAMTAPVETTTRGDRLTMRFFLPATLTLETAPVPLDSRIVLRETDPETLAVLSFSGSVDDASILARQQELQDRVTAATTAGSLWRITGEPRTMLYDPPWTLPFLRRNEVAVPVVRVPDPIDG
jgi:hypothetical protein